ncbi:MAG: SHOCT domain-containing protein [Mycobacteriales bacterium]
MMGYPGDMMWGGLVWGLLILLLLAAIAGTTTYLVIHARRTPGFDTDPGRSPSRRIAAADILRRRYAAGEIDEDEYSRRLAFIEQY